MTVILDHVVSNHGFLTYRDMEERKLSYPILKQLLSLGVLESDERGIYRLPETYIDEYFSLQYRYPKGIYSLDMALWLHGLSLTIPFDPTMTFPYGTNTVKIREAGIKPIVVRSHYDIGAMELERQPGQTILVYDKERSLVECLRSVYKMDVQVVAPAFKDYFEQGKVNLSKLFHYARLFKVEKKLQSYIEVLL
ncbi:Abortive phage infection protein [Streptococcus agalactiae]|nr:Abortive phage infection protein [Streptococcus agalactiae]EJZ04129.1 hypothetical protein M3M_00465 [Streptococcus agalactiae STIR-CD-17]EPU02597.1 abortive phage infection protein [Streptococcus agalactiae STIR-CD-13]EPU03843.1 abortive phage infection protein [Streptococcus agalactiae STIR-CD-09]EPW81303.1 abortive phage infection protein [Streptococcus agalactiae STIR-CD-07]